MAVDLLLLGDLNLMGVSDPEVPFKRVGESLGRAAARFANLECCLGPPPPGHSREREGFFADPEVAGKALRSAGINAVGLANNVNYGTAAVSASIDRLDRLGIPHTGAGDTLALARAPAILERQGVRFGFLQRSSVYWPTGHEAGEEAPGIAVIRGHTAYRVPLYKAPAGMPPLNRPGIPPEILTWADPDYLESFAEDISALRKRVDVLVASCHWGLGREVLHYMREIGKKAIEAGADIVIGHGPHFSLPVEFYQGKPIFYGLGSFSFMTGHHARRHGDWLGMMVRLSVGGGPKRASFAFVRHNEKNETLLRSPAEEAPAFAELKRESALLGARLEAEGEEVAVSAGAKA